VPDFEKMLVRSGIRAYQVLVSITDEEQYCASPCASTIRSSVEAEPMDLESRRHWEQYTKAKETMLERTHIAEARWWVVEANDKKRARLNCIHHLLAQIPTGEVPQET